MSTVALNIYSWLFEHPFSALSFTSVKLLSHTVSLPNSGRKPQWLSIAALPVYTPRCEVYPLWTCFAVPLLNGAFFHYFFLMLRDRLYILFDEMFLLIY